MAALEQALPAVQLHPALRHLVHFGMALIAVRHQHRPHALLKKLDAAGRSRRLSGRRSYFWRFNRSSLVLSGDRIRSDRQQAEQAGKQRRAACQRPNGTWRDKKSHRMEHLTEGNEIAQENAFILPLPLDPMQAHWLQAIYQRRKVPQKLPGEVYFLY